MPPGEHHELRRAVGLAFLGEDVLPQHLGAAEHARRRTGRSRRSACRCGARPAAAALRLLVAAAVADEDVGAARSACHGSMPSAQPTRPSTTMPPMPSPPAPIGMPPIPPPPPKPPPSPRRSSTLSLSGMSSQRIAILRRPTRQLLPGAQREVQSRNTRDTPLDVPIRSKSIWFRSDLNGRPRFAVKPIFTLRRHPSRSSVVGPASPTASPESEF